MISTTLTRSLRGGRVDLITAAIPFFFLFMGVEAFVGRRRRLRIFRGPDVVSDLSLGTLQTVVGVLTAALIAGVYHWVFAHRLVTPTGHPAVVFLCTFIAVDFLYYWFHRCAHRMMLGWVSHAPHHSSEDYNLAVALRQGPLQTLFSIWFYLPLAILGVPFESFVLISSINTIYQFWIHTELIGRLGPLEWIFNTPSHHRVHHGCDVISLDKNHGGVFIVWDRLFGTFVEETSRPVYGTVKPVSTWNPLRVTWSPLGELVDKVRASRSLGELVRSVAGPPEWQPALALGSSSSSMSSSLSSSSPSSTSSWKVGARVTGPRAPYDAYPSSSVARYVWVQLVVVIGLSVGFLIQGPMAPWPAMGAMALWLVWSFGALGALLDQSPRARAFEIARHVVGIPVVVAIVLAVR